MGMFDQAARQAAKIDAPAFFRWLFGLADPPLVFRGWLDPRRLPSAGAADLTGDAVADFADRTEPGGRFALVLEMQTEPDADAVERLALYALGLRLELRNEAGKRRVGAAVVNLTGSPAPARLDLSLPGVADIGFFLRPLQRNLADEDAAGTLADITARRTGRCLLAWIPLMHGGGEEVIITEWKRLAEAEPDAVLRSVYAALALTFAELTRGLVAWQRALENWNMQESQTMLGWLRRGESAGELRRMRTNLIRTLEVRFRAEVPADLKAAVEGTNDLGILGRWFDAALIAPSLADFRATMTATWNDAPMRIALLSAGDGWHVRDLRRAAAALGHEALAVDFRRATAAVATADPAGSLADFDGVLVRTMPPGSLEQVVFRMDLLHRLQARGVRVLNPPRAVEICVDKYLATALLEAAGLRVPPTVVCQHADAALEAFSALGGDVVVKPVFGSEGRGMVRVSDPEMAWRTFRALERTQAVLYLQQFIRHPGWDLRIFVVGGRVLTAMRRRSRGDWRTNVAQGGAGEPIRVGPEEERLALRAAAALGAPVAGVDLLPGPGGEWYVLEVNAVPGWRALAPVTGVDVAAVLVRFLTEEYRLG